MSYEEAFSALKAGEYERAAKLFEPAAREMGYGSDIINNAYTLALHLAADQSRLADVAFRVGKMLLPDDPASALDYFQRALFAGLDGKRSRQIGEVFEEWSEAVREKRYMPVVPISVGRVPILAAAPPSLMTLMSPAASVADDL